MGTVPLYVWNHLLSADNKDGLVARPEQPVLPEELENRQLKFQQLRELDPYLLERLIRLFRMFDAVYCPSSPRHIQSATLICEFFKLPAPVRDSRLDAVDYGDFKGQPMSRLKPPHSYIETPYPGGESWRQCVDRWRSFFEEVLPKHNNHPVLLAGQTRAAIRMCAHLCDGMKLSEAVDLDVTDLAVRWVYFYEF
jgi:broad specificity phosphatase PhoE